MTNGTVYSAIWPTSRTVMSINLKFVGTVKLLALINETTKVGFVKKEGSRETLFSLFVSCIQFLF